jgi:hypothetical protein
MNSELYRGYILKEQSRQHEFISRFSPEEAEQFNRFEVEMDKIINSPEFNINEDKKIAIFDNYRYAVSSELIYKAEPSNLVIENNLKKVIEDCNKFSTNG